MAGAYSLDQLLFGILMELKIANDFRAEANARTEELEEMRADNYATLGDPADTLNTPEN